MEFNSVDGTYFVGSEFLAETNDSFCRIAQVYWDLAREETSETIMI